VLCEVDKTPPPSSSASIQSDGCVTCSLLLCFHPVPFLHPKFQLPSSLSHQQQHLLKQTRPVTLTFIPLQHSQPQPEISFPYNSHSINPKSLNSFGLSTVSSSIFGSRHPNILIPLPPFSASMPWTLFHQRQHLLKQTPVTLTFIPFAHSQPQPEVSTPFISLQSAAASVEADIRNI